MIEKRTVKALPSSFVAADMKLAADRGAGEAKLWVGQMTNVADLDAFFEFDGDYTYTFSRDNLIDYMNQMKLEYVFHKFNDYKNASLKTWNENLSKIKTLSEQDLKIRLVRFTDAARYYVRAEDDVFKKVFRKIAVPKLTDVVFSKDSDSKTITITLEINLNYESIVPETHIDLREQFEEYITNVLCLKSTRQVNDLGNLSRMLIEAGVLDKDVYSISDVDEFRAVVDIIKNSAEYKKDKADKKEKSPNSGLAYDQGLTNYDKFLVYLNGEKYGDYLVYNTSITSKMPRNRIIFGAPGTGKSFMLNRERKALLGDDNETDYERVTFHPDYSYANFVGTYKPVPSVDSDGKDAITYEYVPGPFMRVYVNALKNGRTKDVRPFLLIIEEINRANVAAVFGDIFQLLDRDETNVSEYPIQASEDMKKYLAKELGGVPDDYGKIKLPNNMFIWATMNSADQGVFPMDTAFKRRWDFTYIGIDDNDADIQGKTVVLGTAKRQRVEWNKLRKAINRFLAKQKINEDKQLGPYFISRSIVVPENGNEIDSAAFTDTFKNKVLMYLFEDAAKQKRSTLFEGCFEGKGRYSEICREFEEKGIGIFYHEIALDTEPEDLAAANGDITETGDEQV